MSHHDRSVWRPAPAELLVPLATLVVVGLTLVDPLRRSDLMVFLRAASDVAHGVNPYTATTDPSLWGGSAYVYPYLTAYLFVPLTLIPVPLADLIWFALSAAGVVYGCRLLGLRDPIAISAVLASGACIRSMQVGALNMLLFFAAAVMWRYRDRPAVLALAFMFFAGSKLFLLPVAIWVLFTRSRRTVLAAAAALGGFLGLGLLLQPITTREFLDSMNLLAVHEGPTSMSSLRWATALFPDDVARLVPFLLGGVIVLVAIVYRFRRPESGDAVLFAASILASMVSTPVYWSHYTVLLAVVVLLGHPTRRAAVLFAFGTWLVARPVHTGTNLQLSFSWRMALLYGGMAAALGLVVTRRREPEPSTTTLELVEAGV
jgi:hypothetical protein